MTKLRAWAGMTLAVAMLGLAAGVGWANLPADPPVAPEVVAAEPEVAPQPSPKDGKPGEAWPLARRITVPREGILRNVSEDGKSVTMHYGSTIYGVSLVGQTHRLPRITADNRIMSFAISPDGAHLVTAEGVNGVKIRNARTGELLEGVWPSGDMPAERVAFTADGSKFVVLSSRPSPDFPSFGGSPGERAKMMRDLAKKATRPYRLTVWDLATRKEVGHRDETLQGHSVQSGSVSIAGHGRFVLKAELITKVENDEETFASRRYTIADPVTNKSTATVELTEPRTVLFTPDPLSPDGRTLVLTNPGNEHELRFLDTATGKDRFRVLEFRRPVKAVAFSPDGRFVAAGTGVNDISGRGDTIAAPSEVVIWDAATGKELARLIDKDRIRTHGALAFSRDGSFLVSQNGSSFGTNAFRGELTIWGNPPAVEPDAIPERKPKEKKAASSAPKAPADVPDRFQTLFASLAAEGTTDAKRVEALFLAALGRLPSDVEARTLVSQLSKRTDKAEAMKDLLGTLVETAEFKAHAEALGRLAK